MPISKHLRIFLCHAKEDKLIIRELYRQLIAEGWLDVWFDEEKLLPGQEWDIEIEKAVEKADVVVVCLSNKSVDKEGYVQKEIRFVLNIADEKPEGTIFIVPLRLDDCTVPRRLRAWQWVDYFPNTNQKWAYLRVLESLKLRAGKLGISPEQDIPNIPKPSSAIDDRELHYPEPNRLTQANSLDPSFLVSSMKMYWQTLIAKRTTKTNSTNNKSLSSRIGKFLLIITIGLGVALIPYGGLINSPEKMYGFSAIWIVTSLFVWLISYIGKFFSWKKDKKTLPPK